MIIISGHFHGPELKGSRIDRAISTAMKVMKQVREPEFGGTLGKIPHVNAVFEVEGSLGAPKFRVVDLGPYSRKDQCVQVRIAVTAADAGERNLRDVLVLGLRGANAAAFHFFDDKGMNFPLREAEALVTRVGEKLEDFT